MSELTLAQANTIIAAALAQSKTAGYKPMGIAVLDASGNLKAFASEDASGRGTKPHGPTQGAKRRRSDRTRTALVHPTPFCSKSISCKARVATHTLWYASARATKQMGLFQQNDGGAERDRTDDLLHAMQALYQLSYSPKKSQKIRGKP